MNIQSRAKPSHDGKQDSTATYAAIKSVAGMFYGEVGTWSYDRFEHHNRVYFDNQLSVPMIRFELTPHGGSIGLCGSSLTGHTVISLVPYLLNNRHSIACTNLADIPLGRLNLIDDVLLHEMIHQSVAESCRRESIPTPQDSHNNNLWIAECNRIAKLLGFNDYKAGRNQTKRVPVSEGGGTYKATPKGCVEYREVFSFPHATYRRLGSDRYTDGEFDLFDIRL